MQVMMKGRRIGLSVMAIVLAAALVLTGTFAWTSINQQALNPAHGIDRYVEVPLIAGGRLHDHFEYIPEWEVGDTANKNVFVENFRGLYNADGEPIDYANYTGPRFERALDSDGDEVLVPAQDIFARVRLTEFMMINDVPVVPGTAPGDFSNWTPGLMRPGTATGAPSQANPILSEFWDWGLGGRTDYIPTFNRDPQSRESDTRGAAIDPQFPNNPGTSLDTRSAVTRQWTNEGLYVPAPANAENPFPVEAGGTGGNACTEPSHEARVHDGDDFSATPVTHYVRDTMPNAAMPTMPAANGVISYAAWSVLPEDQQIGPFWVVDADGWAYWMLPIPAGTSTGLLLSNITLDTANAGGLSLEATEPGQEIEWWYAIHVTSEMATEEEWENWGVAPGAGLHTQGRNIMSRLAPAGATAEGIQVNFTQGTEDEVTGMPANQFIELNDAGIATLALPTAVPTRAGYVFAGWELDGNLLPADAWPLTLTAAAGDEITLTAAWEVDERLIINPGLPRDEDGRPIATSPPALGSQGAMDFMHVEGWFEFFNDHASIPLASILVDFDPDSNWETDFSVTTNDPRFTDSRWGEWTPSGNGDRHLSIGLDRQGNPAILYGFFLVHEDVIGQAIYTNTSFVATLTRGGQSVDLVIEGNFDGMLVNWN